MAWQTNGRWRDAMLRALPIVLALATVLLTPGIARAIEVSCVEASRYKYLYLLFGNDRTRFARFFDLDAQQAPPPEACRALLITGRIEQAKRGEPQNDFTNLLAQLDAGRGWVTTLYLASGGGSVGMGLQLGEATRMFWLKTHTVDGATFDYVPDFLGAQGPGAPVQQLPAGMEAGWRAYQAATRSLATVRVTQRGRRRCASACTFLHVAGIQRYGVSYFHRARPGTPRPASGNDKQPPRTPPSMSEMLESLHRTEAWIIAFYRYMDAGDEAVQFYQSTATQTVRAGPVPLSPRYIADHLAGACSSKARGARQRSGRADAPLRLASAESPRGINADMSLLAQLAAQPPLAKGAPDKFPPQPPPSPAPPIPAPSTPAPSTPSPPSVTPQQAPSPAAVADPETLRCVAAMHERERLTQFAKLCEGGCDRAELQAEATRRAVALRPPAPDNPRRNAPRRPAQR